MATSLIRKMMKKPQTIAAIVVVLIIAVMLFSAPISGQTAKFYAAQERSLNVQPPLNVQPISGKSVTVGLKVGESAAFNGKTITLKNVGSATINPPVIVDVDGAVDTVTGTETVNGIIITPKATLYWANDVKLRYAILTLVRESP